MEGQWPDMCPKQPSWATIDERGKQERKEEKKKKRFSMDILFYGRHDCVQGPLELIGAIKGKKEQGWTMSEIEAMAKGKRGQLAAEDHTFWFSGQSHKPMHVWLGTKTRELETRRKRQSNKWWVELTTSRLSVAQRRLSSKTGVHDRRYLVRVYGLQRAHMYSMSKLSAARVLQVCQTGAAVELGGELGCWTPLQLRWLSPALLKAWRRRNCGC
ncbi:hypothetical protein J3F84DRAFT_318925 [Trichoderma pleuroticola]